MNVPLEIFPRRAKAKKFAYLCIQIEKNFEEAEVNFRIPPEQKFHRQYRKPFSSFCAKKKYFRTKICDIPARSVRAWHLRPNLTASGLRTERLWIITSKCWNLGITAILWYSFCLLTNANVQKNLVTALTIPKNFKTVYCYNFSSRYRFFSKMQSVIFYATCQRFSVLVKSIISDTSSRAL